MVGWCSEFQDSQNIVKENLFFFKKNKSVAGYKGQKAFTVLQNAEVDLWKYYEKGNIWLLES